jgi:lysophospholipase L1-like esterase
MKKITGALVLSMIILPACLFAQDRTLTFLGDSRTVGMAMAEGCECSPYHTHQNCMEYINLNGCGYKVVSNATEDNGIRILADGAITGMHNLGKGGQTANVVTKFLLEHNYVGYESYATHISLGGNDLNTYMAEFSSKIRNNSYRSYPWDWDFETKTDEIAGMVEYIISFILSKSTTNRVLLNDVAPILASVFIQNIGNINNISWDLFELLNLKYQNIVSKMGSRVAYLSTFDTFKNNLTSCSCPDTGNCLLLCYFTFKNKHNRNDCYRQCGFFVNSCLYFTDDVHFSLKGNQKWGQMIAQRLVELNWYEPYVTGNPKLLGYSLNRCGDLLNVQLSYNKRINSSLMNASNSRVYIDHYYSVYEDRVTQCAIYHPSSDNPGWGTCCLACYLNYNDEDRRNRCYGWCNQYYPPWTEYVDCPTGLHHWHDQNETIALPFKYTITGDTALVFEANASLTQTSDPSYDFLNINDKLGGDEYFLPAYDYSGLLADRPDYGQLPPPPATGGVCP